MRLILGALVLLAMLTVLGAALNSRAYCFRPFHEFAVDPTRKSSTLRHSFGIFNYSFRPARILNVKSSCGCTVTRFTKVIPPFEFRQIECELLFGPDDVERSVHLAVSLESHPPLALSLNAYSIQCIGLSKDSLDLGTTSKPSQLVGTFRVLVPHRDDTLDITDPEGEFEYNISDEIIARGGRGDDRFGVWKTVIARLRNRSIGDHIITAMVKPGAAPPMPITIRWSVTPLTAFVPNRLSLAISNYDNESLHVTARFVDDGSKLDLGSAEFSSECDWLKVVAVEREQSHMLRIDLQILPELLKKNQVAGVLVVRFTSGETFQLPVNASLLL